MRLSPLTSLCPVLNCPYLLGLAQLYPGMLDEDLNLLCVFMGDVWVDATEHFLVLSFPK